MIRNLLAHRYLIAQMTQREVLQRYRGSMLGIVWSFILPLVMLAVYMFVFSVVFKTRWGLEQENDLQFGVILFSGLIVHALFTECLTRAPGLITSNVQLVKKVVFPLEILPLITLCSAFCLQPRSLLRQIEALEKHACISSIYIYIYIYIVQGTTGQHDQLNYGCCCCVLQM